MKLIPLLILTLCLSACHTTKLPGNNTILTYTIADTSFHKRNTTLRSMVVLPGQQLYLYIANSTPQPRQVNISPNTTDITATPTTALLNKGDTMKVTITSQTAQQPDTIRYTHLSITLHQGGNEYRKTFNLFYRKEDKSK